MTALLIIIIAIVLLFCGVVAVGAPFLPTLARRVDDALDLLSLQPGQTMLELGSGDGRMLRAAAQRGIRSVGYELNPLLALYSRLLCWRYRELVEVRWGNYWQGKWPESDGMYVFLLQPYMGKLHKKVAQYTKDKPYKLVSFGFEIPGVEPKKTDKGMFLYTYPMKSK